ncbi:hypothetical protein PG984_011664 [Apiospora sp. TS-2023a]
MNRADFGKIENGQGDDTSAPAQDVSNPIAKPPKNDNSQTPIPDLELVHRRKAARARLDRQHKRGRGGRDDEEQRFEKQRNKFLIEVAGGHTGSQDQGASVATASATASATLPVTSQPSLSQRAVSPAHASHATRTVSKRSVHDDDGHGDDDDGELSPPPPPKRARRTARTSNKSQMSSDNGNEADNDKGNEDGEIASKED